MFKSLNSLTIISSKGRDFWIININSKAFTTRNWTARKLWAPACHLQAWATLCNVCRRGWCRKRQVRRRQGGNPAGLGLCMKVWPKVVCPAIRWYRGLSCRHRARTNHALMLDMLHMQLQRQLFQVSYSWWKRTPNCSLWTKTFKCKWKIFKYLAWDQITPKAIS